MKCSTQAALAIGAGYLLGRRRKMRLAAMLAAGAATGGLGSLGGKALQRGVKMLGSTEALGKFAPQLGELADTVRGDLIDAGKAAATAAVSNRIESLTDSLHERAEVVRDPGAAAGKAARSGADEATGRLRRRGKRTADDEDGDEPRDEEEPEFDEADYEEGDEPEADEPEADEPEPAPRRRRATARRSPDGPEAAPSRRRATTRRRSPVARAGR